MQTENGGCRVLVVDDEKLMRDGLKLILTKLGAEIIGEADNGADAVKAYTQHKPDITFLDIEMPGQNGIDALKEIVNNDPSAFVVMLSATKDMEIADKCIEQGAKNYVRKGVEPKILEMMLLAQIDLFKKDVRTHYVN